MFHSFGWAGTGYGMPMFGYGGYYGSHYWIMGLVGLVIVTSLVLSIIALVKSSKSKTASVSDSLRILDTRYAQGEITKEQYETMKKDLR